MVYHSAIAIPTPKFSNCDGQCQCSLSTTEQSTYNTHTRKSDIIAWLSSNNISHNPLQTRAELLLLVNANKPVYRTYEINQIAKEHGHQVVRLPPYHCHYNPIEMIWAQVKAYVAEKNNTFRIADVESLTRAAIESITVSAWADCVRHAGKLQAEDYDQEI